MNRFLIILFNGEVWFHHSRYVKSPSKFPVLIHEVPFHDMIGLWLAMSETVIAGPTFFYETIKSHHYVTYSDTNF